MLGTHNAIGSQGKWKMATGEARKGGIAHIPFVSGELRLQRSSGLLATDRISEGRETWAASLHPQLGWHQVDGPDQCHGGKPRSTSLPPI
jgi:hypothetical protein